MIIIAIICAVILLAAGAVLVLFANGTVTLLVIAIMLVILTAGFLVGILPVFNYARGFRHGYNSLLEAEKNESGTTWLSVLKMENFFAQKYLDRQFTEYKGIVAKQYKNHQIMKDIGEYFNEDVLGIKTWQRLMTMIPTTMTGLGLLGTFIGLVTGINGISISSVDATVESIQNLIGSIGVAFYTSIAGVIFSLLFSMIYNLSWNLCMREAEQFTDRFHKSVVPSEKEQVNYRERVEARQILDRLERLPKNAGFSVSNTSSISSGSGNLTEQVLMPRIQTSLRNEEFTFFLQAQYSLDSETICGAEALVRWKHAKLGFIQPSIFIPMLEANGYITKLDQYIWEKVCKTLRSWLDEGKMNKTISINVSKTDVLAMDVADFLLQMVQKYHLPPRYISVEIAENAYILAKEETVSTQNKLRASGVEVVVDGFDGNFLWMQEVEGFEVDALKLDLRQLEDYRKANAIFEQARSMGLNVRVEGIETMEQLSLLLRNGCKQGQGYYFSKPMEIAEFEKSLEKETAI